MGRGGGGDIVGMRTESVLCDQMGPFRGLPAVPAMPSPAAKPHLLH